MQVATTIIHACPPDGTEHICSPFCPCEPELVIGEGQDEDNITGEVSDPFQQIIYRHRGVDGKLVEDFGCGDE